LESCSVRIADIVGKLRRRERWRNPYGARHEGA
jgi:hypothetical protein